MKILVVDNYDSFTYNLVHIISPFTNRTDVIRNDECHLSGMEQYDGIVLSPGPGLPEHVPILEEIILNIGTRIPLLGICLGHQAIAKTFGADLINMDEVCHGLEMNTKICRPEDPLFTGLPSIFRSGRYHSWTVDPVALPECLKITAIDDEGRIMAISHKKYNIKGVQFHPESVMTPYGRLILSNWLKFSVKK